MNEERLVRREVRSFESKDAFVETSVVVRQTMDTGDQGRTASSTVERFAERRNVPASIREEHH